MSERTDALVSEGEIDRRFETGRRRKEGEGDFHQTDEINKDCFFIHMGRLAFRELYGLHPL